MRHGPLALAALSLAACATQSGDPCATANQPVNLGTLMSSSFSGAYDQCLDTMRDELAAARLRSRGLEAEAASLRAEQRRLSGEQAAAAGRLAELNETQAATMAELSTAEGQREVESAELRRVLNEERQITRQIEQLNVSGGGASAAEAERLRLQQERLRARIRALDI